MRKRPDEVTFIAIYHFIMGGFALLTTCLTGLILVLVSSEISQGLSSAETWVLILVILLIILGLVYSIIVGFGQWIIAFGLLNLKSWARWGSIIISFSALFNFPIGTIVGIFILYYLLGEKGKTVFEY